MNGSRLASCTGYRENMENAVLRNDPDALLEATKVSPKTRSSSDQNGNTTKLYHISHPPPTNTRNREQPPRRLSRAKCGCFIFTRRYDRTYDERPTTDKRKRQPFQVALKASNVKVTMMEVGSTRAG